MLRKLQENFIAAVEDKTLEGILTPEIAENGFNKNHLIEVYRNNHFSFKMEALAATYTRVKELLGEKIFNAGAKEYIKRNPSVSGNLDEYGDKFAEFLKISAVGLEKPYLVEVAALEWLLHSSEVAEKIAAITPQDLANIPPEKLGELKLQFSPQTHLFKSEFAVNDIIKGGNQFGKQDQYLLVVKPEFEPEIKIIDKDEYIFLNALNSGKNLEEAFEAVANEDFNILEILVKNIGFAVFAQNS